MSYANPYHNPSPVRDVPQEIITRVSAAEEVENIHRSIATINEVLDMLVNTLAPITKANDRPYPKDTNVQEAQSPLVEALQGAHYRLEDITRRLYDLKDSIQL